MTIKEHLSAKLSKLSSDTILIHSDILQGFKIKFKSRESFISSHMEEIFLLLSGLNIWMPTFNYDFTKSKQFHVVNTPSQVGALTEYFRINFSNWRTHIPIFSFAGMGKMPVLESSNIIDPFSSNSAFQLLYDSDSVLLHYGSSLSSSTILHYAEKMSNLLTYRYDKLFEGEVHVNEDLMFDAKLNFHVRPLGKHLEYDWLKIEKDIQSNNILFSFEDDSCRILVCKIRELVDFWVFKMSEDSMYLLDDRSKKWIEPLLDKLGRKFLIADFER